MKASGMWPFHGLGGVHETRVFGVLKGDDPIGPHRLIFAGNVANLIVLDEDKCDGDPTLDSGLAFPNLRTKSGIFGSESGERQTKAEGKANP